jgi:hypothetical protein
MTLSYRERMVRTLRGEKCDRIPLVPRLDQWYKANKYRGTLPEKYKKATLLQILEDLDLGYHTVAADRDLYDDYLDNVDRPLGIWRVRTMPYHVKFPDLRRNIQYEGDETIVEYVTPAGKLLTRVIYSEAMRKAGVTLSHVKEHLIKGPDDYEAAAFLFESARVHPNYEGLFELKEKIGERGLLVGTAGMGASAMHHLLHELMAYDRFFIEYFERYDELSRLAARLTPFMERVLDVALASPADIIQSGTNYDVQLTWPSFMEREVVPHLIRTADKCHRLGKYLLNHTDGENKGLLPFFIQGNIDIADSICPAPMTGLTLKEIRDAFAGRITVWGGIPAVSVLENSLSDYEFAAYLDDLFSQIGAGDHLILSIADTAPPDMKFSRLELIRKKVEEFGAVTPPGKT